MTESTIKKCIVSGLLISTMTAPSAFAGMNVNLDLTVPVSRPAPPPAPEVIYVPAPPPVAPLPPPDYPAPPAPTYAAPPPPPVVYVAPVVLPAAPPQFVFVPELGYYVAAGVAFDMLYDGRSYYYHNGGYWYRTAYYGGAWSPVAQRMMPPMILKFQIGDIHRFSNKEFHRYKTEGARYRGKTHRPEEHRGREGEREREIKREEHR